MRSALEIHVTEISFKFDNGQEAVKLKHIILCFVLKNAGVQPDQQMELLRILSAILHLGNVNIQASGRSSERSYIDVRN